MLIDHDEIRQWAEERDAQPACVGATEQGDSCLLRLDFPDEPPDTGLDPISWDDWFRIFDENDLALIVEDQLADGRPSNFNKIVARETVEERLQRGNRSRRSSTSRQNARGQNNSRSQQRRAA